MKEKESYGGHQRTKHPVNRAWSKTKRDRCTQWIRFIFSSSAFQCNVMYFNSSWTEMSIIDMIMNSLLEIWNPVWTKRQKLGKPPRRLNSPFTLLGTTMFAFFLFLQPGFLPRFCPRHLSFRWIHNVSFHGLYIKKFVDSNDLNNAKQRNVN